MIEERRLLEVIQCFEVKDKEPDEEGQFVVLNNGYPYLAIYLPSRGGEKYGEWDADDFIEKVNPNDKYVDISAFCLADFVYGKIKFVEEKA